VVERPEWTGGPLWSRRRQGQRPGRYDGGVPWKRATGASALVACFALVAWWVLSAACGARSDLAVHERSAPADGGSDARGDGGSDAPNDMSVDSPRDAPTDVPS
jgi:hypothetical protein